MERRLTRLLVQFNGEGSVQFELSVIIDDDVLIPDVVVLASYLPALHRDILNEPPLLCIEAQSPSQRPAEMLAKCERYRDFRVPFCWVLDPIGGRAWEYHLCQEEPREVAEIFSGPCPVRLSDVFAA